MSEQVGTEVQALTPLEARYVEAYELVDITEEAKRHGDTANVLRMKEFARLAFRKAHDENPLLRAITAYPA